MGEKQQKEDACCCGCRTFQKVEELGGEWSEEWGGTSLAFTDTSIAPDRASAYLVASVDSQFGPVGARGEMESNTNSFLLIYRRGSARSRSRFSAHFEQENIALGVSIAQKYGAFCSQSHPCLRIPFSKHSGNASANRFMLSKANGLCFPVQSAAVLCLHISSGVTVHSTKREIWKRGFYDFWKLGQTCPNDVITRLEMPARNQDEAICSLYVSHGAR